MFFCSHEYLRALKHHLHPKPPGNGAYSDMEKLEEMIVAACQDKEDDEKYSSLFWRLGRSPANLKPWLFIVCLL